MDSVLAMDPWDALKHVLAWQIIFMGDKNP
jgi:hypothetical protein